MARAPGSVVNVKSIHAVNRSVAGTCTIRFRDIPDSLTYARLFRQM